MEYKNIVAKLCKVQKTNKEIKLLTNELKELNQMSYVKSPQITGLPTGGMTKDKIADAAIEKTELESQIQGVIAKACRERREAENILELLDDSEKRMIVRFRCINNMTWQEMAAELFMSESTVRRKYKLAILTLQDIL